MLTSGNVVIHYDRWWNAARENQATDRVHRMGQTRGVQVFKLVTLGTFEERIDALIAKKASLMHKIIGTDEPRPKERGLFWKGFQPLLNSEVNDPALKDGVSKGMDEESHLKIFTKEELFSLLADAPSRPPKKRKPSKYHKIVFQTETLSLF